MRKFFKYILKNKKDILITSALIVCFAGLLSYNIVSFEIVGRKVQERIKRHEILEAQQQEKLVARQVTRKFIELRSFIRNQDIKEIITFNEEYSGMKGKYISRINIMSEELENKVVNIDDIRSLVDTRIDAVEQFRDGVMSIDKIPEPLEDFYDLLLEFLNNDIFTWRETKSYYSGTYNGDDADIKGLHRKNSELYRQVEDMQQEIYSQYDLDSLL